MDLICFLLRFRVEQHIVREAIDDGRSLRRGGTQIIGKPPWKTNYWAILFTEPGSHELCQFLSPPLLSLKLLPLMLSSRRPTRAYNTA